MGLIDAQLRFSNAQAITATAASTNIVDLDVARDIAVGRPLYLLVVVTTAFTDSGSDSTVAVSARFDSTTTITPDASYTVATIPALSAAGYKVYIPLHPLVGTKYRYMDVAYTVSGGDLSTGAVSAQIVMQADDNFIYANGYDIS